MANSVIAFLFAIGVTVWVYAKFMHKTGNNTKSSVIASAIIGILLFILSLMILNMLTVE